MTKQEWLKGKISTDAKYCEYMADFESFQSEAKEEGFEVTEKDYEEYVFTHELYCYGDVDKLYKSVKYD